MADAATDEIGFILDTYHSAALLDMAQAAGLDVIVGKRKLPKSDLSDKVRTEFFTRERVLASLSRLDPRERAVLDRLLLRDGSAPTRSFRREIIRAGLATEAPQPDKPGVTGYARPRDGVPYAGEKYSGSPNHRNSIIFEDVIARLTLHGLVFSRDTGATTPAGVAHKLQFHPANTLYIPNIVKQHLPQPAPLPPSEVASPERVQHTDPSVLLRDLYLYWDFVRRNQVTLLQNGSLAKRALKAINEILLAPDPLIGQAKGEKEARRLSLLRQLLESHKLIHRAGGLLCSTDQDPLRIAEFWNWPQARQLSACVQAWLRLGEIGELDNRANQYVPQYAHARQVLLDVLKASPVGGWLDLSDFVEQVRGKDVNFLFAEHSRVEAHRGGWYYSYTGGHYYGQAPEILKMLERYESEFVRACLEGFLHQAGMVDLGFPQEGDRLQAFCLTSLGQSVLRQEWLAPESGESGRFVIQPNFQIMAMGPVSLAVLARLDLCAERRRADRGAFEYRLSRESVYRAQQLGMSASEVIGFLESVGHADLPQNVRRSLEEWAAHHERIVFRTGVSLLQAADADLLAQLMQDPQAGPHLDRLITPEVALVKNKGRRKLVSTLVEQGLFPAVSSAQPQSADRSAIVEEDGTVRAVHAVPSLYLRGRIGRLAEEAGRGGEWRLTPGSIRRAGGDKARVLGILQELDKLHRGTGLPPGLVEQIKAWGGYYGDAAAETLTLIEFHDPSAVEELVQHPELMAYLTPFPAGNRALAIVPQDKLARVKEILAGLGVSVKEGLG